MPKTHILAIDQGTTGSTALIINDRMEVVGRANREFTQRFPQAGWVEHDPRDILRSVEEAVRAALADSGVSPPRPRRHRRDQPARDRGALGPRHR